MTDKGPRRAVRESVGRECACARKNDASYVALFWKTNSWDPFSATSEAEMVTGLNEFYDVVLPQESISFDRMRCGPIWTLSKCTMGRENER